MAACPNSPAAAALPTFRKARRPAFFFWTGFSISNLPILLSMIVFYLPSASVLLFLFDARTRKRIEDAVLTPGPGYHPARAGGHQRRGAVPARRDAARAGLSLGTDSLHRSEERRVGRAEKPRVW